MIYFKSIRKLFFRFVIALTALLCLEFGLYAQHPIKTTFKINDLSFEVHSFKVILHDKLDSKLMGRDMPYRVLIPLAYFNEASESKKFPVIYLLHGLSGHFDNWTDKAKLAEYTFGTNLIIVTPEGGDGWYTDSVSVPGDKYESYIIQELLPEIDKKFRTNGTRDGRAVAGLSMGGYGAIKFGLKYPQLFSLVGSFSGALDAPLRGQGHQFLRPSIMSVFGEDGSRARKDNDIFGMIKEMHEEKIKLLPFIYMDCGTEDWLFQTNREFAGLLLEKKIPHEFRQLPGKHEWKFWDSQVKEFLEVAPRFLTAK